MRINNLISFATRLAALLSVYSVSSFASTVSEQTQTILRTLVGDRCGSTKIEKALEPVTIEFYNFKASFYEATTWAYSATVTTTDIRNTFQRDEPLNIWFGAIESEIKSMAQALVSANTGDEIIDMITRKVNILRSSEEEDSPEEDNLMSRLNQIKASLTFCKEQTDAIDLPPDALAKKQEELIIGRYIFGIAITRLERLQQNLLATPDTFQQLLDENPGGLFPGDIFTYLENMNTQISKIVKVVGIKRTATPH
jgi:hypothetical protein